MKKSKRFSRQVMIDYLREMADSINLGFDPKNGYAQTEGKNTIFCRQYAQWELLNTIILDLEQNSLE